MKRYRPNCVSGIHAVYENYGSWRYTTLLDMNWLCILYYNMTRINHRDLYLFFTGDASKNQKTRAEVIVVKTIRVLNLAHSPKLI